MIFYMTNDHEVAKDCVRKTGHPGWAGARRLDHDGPTVEAAFQRAARQVFEQEGAPPGVSGSRTVPISFVHYGSESVACEKWVKLLLRLAHEHELAFSELHLQRRGTYWWGYAKGMPRATLRVIERHREQRDAQSTRTDTGWSGSYAKPAGTPPMRADADHVQRGAVTETAAR